MDVRVLEDVFVFGCGYRDLEALGAEVYGLSTDIADREDSEVLSKKCKRW